MASGSAKAADDLSSGVKSIVDRVLEADVTETIAQRGKEMAAVLADATETAAERAQQAWRESEPVRRDAQRNLGRASRDATSWGLRAWSRDLRPQLNNLWKRRTLAIGAAGAAVPAGRGLVDAASERLNLRRRERRHWGAFFLGMILGAAAGAAIALLTAPKPGREMRNELAGKAREAAESAPEWVPLFQREPHDGAGEVDDLDQAASAMPPADAEVPTPPRETDEGP